jgi:hypothetical protein
MSLDELKGAKKWLLNKFSESKPGYLKIPIHYSLNLIN